MVKFLLLSLTALIIVSSSVFAADPVKLTDYQMSKVQGAAARTNNAAITRSVLGATAGFSLPTGIASLPKNNSASPKDIKAITAATMGSAMLIAAPAVAAAYSVGVVTDYAVGYAECSLKYGGVLKPGVSNEDAANRSACVGKVAEEALTNPWNILGGVAAGTSVLGKASETTAAKAVQSSINGHSIILAHKFTKATEFLERSLLGKDIFEKIYYNVPEIYALLFNNSDEKLTNVDPGPAPANPTKPAEKPTTSGGSSGGSSGSSSSGGTTTTTAPKTSSPPVGTTKPAPAPVPTAKPGSAPLVNNNNLTSGTNKMATGNSKNMTLSEKRAYINSF